jgi:hypothetical protein
MGAEASQSTDKSLPGEIGHGPQVSGYHDDNSLTDIPRHGGGGLSGTFSGSVRSVIRG